MKKRLDLEEFREKYKPAKTKTVDGKVEISDGDFVLAEAILSLIELMGIIARKT